MQRVQTSDCTDSGKTQAIAAIHNRIARISFIYLQRNSPFSWKYIFAKYWKRFAFIIVWHLHPKNVNARCACVCTSTEIRLICIFHIFVKCFRCHPQWERIPLTFHWFLKLFFVVYFVAAHSSALLSICRRSKVAGRVCILLLRIWLRVEFFASNPCVISFHALNIWCVTIE